MTRILLIALTAGLLAACHCPCQDQDNSDLTPPPATHPANAAGKSAKINLDTKMLPSPGSFTHHFT